jgi:O-antigen/teichoic acid export membrane protein
MEALTLRFGHREQSRGRRWESVVSASASGALGAILAALFIPEGTVAAVLATAALSAAVGAYLIWNASLQSGLRFGTSSAMASARALFGLALAVAGAALTGSAVVAAWGLTAGFATAVAASYALRRPAKAKVAEVRPREPIPSNRFSYGLGSIVIAVGMFELAAGDRFILSAISGLSELGVYAAIYTLQDLVLRLTPTVVLVALRPRIFRAWDGANVGRVTMGTAGVTALIIWSGLGLTAGILLVGHLLGASGTAAPLVGPIAIGLSAGVAASSISFLYSAAERQWRLASHVATAAIVNVALNLMWVPELGALGSAYATAISFVGLLALHAVGLRRSLFENHVFVILSLLSLVATIVIGVGSSAIGGLIWPVAGFVATAALAPVVIRSLQVLIPAIEAPLAP